MLHTVTIGVAGFGQQRIGHRGIEVGQHPGPQRKTRGILAGRTGHAGGGVGKLAPHLGLARTVVDGASQPLAPTVIYLVLRRQFEPFVVTVVGYLVIHLALRRIHAVEPVEPPFDFVDDVGDTVGPGQAVGIVGIAIRSGILQVGKHHLIGGVGRGGHVLQLVARIVPAAPHVNVLATAGGVIDDIAVVGVTAVALKGIEAAALLTHVAQDEVGRAVVHPIADNKARREGIAGPQPIGTGPIAGGEVEPIHALHPAPQARSPRGVETHHLLTGTIVDQRIRLEVDGLVAHIDGHLGRSGQIAQLVHPYPLAAPDGRTERERSRHESPDNLFHVFMLLPVS